ncbi:protein AF-9 [Galendromus occidentalis]|uniref:Protein AF-9 n=1 Tax=Galendromus occidentalis TaxID=34638 RepID=A0AAJ7L7J8_9ACAR|nr:protein AF-9 [Galendromus occidentalis]
MTSQSLEVKIELGHKAVLKETPTAEGYTHDWTVFVRGPEGCRIENFVEKVVFLLHESFPKARRTLREPPYQVSESGYAGFNMPIIVYFKTKEEPKKLQFIYDLYLSLDGKPLNNIRCEKLTFHNPPEDFCQKLFKGGAAIKDNSATTAGPLLAVSPAKKPPTPPQKKSPHLAGAPPTSSQFCGLFGAPIIKGQDAKDGKKEKRKDKKDKDYKRDKKEKSSSAGGKDEKPKESVKSEKPEKNDKVTLTVNANGKSNASHSSDAKKDGIREKKRDNSSSPNHREKDELKRKKKKSSSHKDSPESKKVRLEEPVPPAPASNAAPNSAASTATTMVSKSKKKSQGKESLSSTTTTSTTSPPLGNASEVEFTPSPPDQRKSKTLKEVKNAPNDELKPSLPPPKSQAPRRVSSPADTKKKRPTLQQQPTSVLTALIQEMDADGSSPESETEASRYKRLFALKTKIAKLPREKMQQVVDIVEESGNFEISDESFDFDLHVADATTIHRLQQLVS